MNDALGTPARIVVLGGSSDIARGIVRSLVRPGRGTEVVLAGRPSDARAEAVEQVAAFGADVRTVDLDATDPATHEAAIAAAWSGGDVDVVIVAIGQLAAQEALLADGRAAFDLVTVNTAGPIALGVLVAARLRVQGHGRMLALSSVAGDRPRPANFVYGASKAGLDAFYRGLADELEPHGVSVTVVRPGFVHTRMTHGRDPAPLAASVEQVAAAVTEPRARRAVVLYVPRVLRVVMAVLKLLPRAVFRRLPG